MSGFWKKTYSDGSDYIGTDEEVVKGKASWRQSKNTDMLSASVSTGQYSITISSLKPRNFWQSDSYECDVFSSNGKLIARRICVQLENDDKFYIVSDKHNEHCLTVVLNNLLVVLENLKLPESSVNTQYYCMPSESVGSWLVLEVDPRSGKTKIFFSPRKV